MDPVSWSQLPDTAVLNVLTHLSHKDRAQASSTCRRWRGCYFHPSFWRRVDLRLSVETNCAPFRCILEKCGKFVRELAVTFTVGVPCPEYSCGLFPGGDKADSVPKSMGSEESSSQERQRDDLLKYETLLQVIDGLGNSQGLEKLILSCFPQCEHCKIPQLTEEEYEAKMTDSLKKVMRATSKLKTLALGHSIATPLQSAFLKELSEKFGKQLRVLHIPTFQGADVMSVNAASVMAASLSQFTSLSVLTLNSSVLTDQLLDGLPKSTSAASLQQLNLVTGTGEDSIFPTGVNDASWVKLARRLPDVRVTMSVVIAEDDASDELVSFLKPSMPLFSLRILVSHPFSLKTDLIEEVAKNYNGCLGRLELHTDKATLLFGDDSEADPLVMLCWKCKKLKHIVITGYKLLACNILAMALLRGPSLATFEVERELIYHFDDYVPPGDEDNDETPTSYDSLHSDSLNSETERQFAVQEKIRKISKSLKRPWEPVERRHMSIPKFLMQDLYIDADK